MDPSIVVFSILAIVVLIVGSVIFVTVFNQRRKDIIRHENAEEFFKRQKTAVWASAEILNVRGGIITGNLSGVSGWARYEISLVVKPPNGESYMTRVNWLVDVRQMSIIQQGQQLSVKIDQQDPKIVYPNARWAKYIPD